ncbi:AtpZ/AtpI family protein [Filifactor villosus]|uniref:AtpZ/AtpI family protein n=1 Tax=Filifactor villosus TaxID=29374 RepID=A0ABV9QIT0_9FIRM
MAKNRNDIMYTISLMMQLGISIIAPVILVIMLTKWLIARYHWSENLLLISILVGLTAGFLNAYKLLSRFFKKKL